MVHMPTFPLKQHVQAAISVAHSALVQFLHAHPATWSCQVSGRQPDASSLLFLIFKLFQTPDFRRTHAGINLLPTVKGRLRDNHLATDLTDRGASFRRPSRQRPICSFQKTFLRKRCIPLFSKNVNQIAQSAGTNFRGQYHRPERSHGARTKNGVKTM